MNLKTDKDLTQTFDSTYSAEELKASDRYNADTFEFRHGSEHTVEGKRHDLELQVIHTARSPGSTGINKGVTTVMFSVENYNAQLSPINLRIIDRFFKSMNWDNLEEEKKASETTTEEKKEGEETEKKDEGKRRLQASRNN